MLSSHVSPKSCNFFNKGIIFLHATANSFPVCVDKKIWPPGRVEVNTHAQHTHETRPLVLVAACAFLKKCLISAVGCDLFNS